MRRANGTEWLARSSARHPWITLLVWVAVLGGSFFAATNYLDLTDDGDVTTATESNTGDELLNARFETEGTPLPEGVPVNERGDFGNREFVIVEAEQQTDAATLEATVAKLVDRLRAQGRIAVVQSYLDGDAGVDQRRRSDRAGLSAWRRPRDGRGDRGDGSEQRGIPNHHRGQRQPQ